MEEVEGKNKGPFEGFSPDDEQFLSSLGNAKERANLILLRIKQGVIEETTRLWGELETGLGKANGSQNPSLLPFTNYSLVLDSGLLPNEQWSRFEATINPGMPPEEGLPSRGWMNESINYQTRADILRRLIATSPLPPIEAGWGTAGSKRMQIFYIRTDKYKNCYLVRTSWTRTDGNLLLSENLFYAPSEETLKSFLQQEPSAISASPRR